MNNLLFFLWMLLFPLLEDIGTYLNYKSGYKDSKDNSFFVTLMYLGFYIIVGYILFKFQ